MDKFHYLKIGLGVILAFVGVKMLLGHSPWKIDTSLSLAVIVFVLTASVVASVLWPANPKAAIGGDKSEMPSGQTEEDKSTFTGRGQGG